MSIAAIAACLATTPALAEADAKTFLAKIDAGGNEGQMFLLVLSAYENGFSWANTDLRARNMAPLYCVPEKLAMVASQNGNILRQYVKEHPYNETLPAGLVMLEAMKATFPCK